MLEATGRKSCQTSCSLGFSPNCFEPSGLGVGSWELGVAGFSTSGRERDPLGWRSDLRGWSRTCIRPAAAREPADRANGHIVVAGNLARQSHACHAARGEDIPFCDGHHLRLSGDELDPAGRAACIASTRMKHVHSGVLLDREDEPFSRLHLDRWEPFDRQRWHS